MVSSKFNHQIGLSWSDQDVLRAFQPFDGKCAEILLQNEYKQCAISCVYQFWKQAPCIYHSTRKIRGRCE
jgi:hypothetical protein